MCFYYTRKCNGFRIQNKSATPGQVVFLGDSITDWCDLYQFYGSVFKGKVLYNRGIAGDTTHGVLRRLQCSVFELSPAKIVLMIGTNDITRKVRASKIIKNYQSIIASIKAGLPDTSITVLGVTPRGVKHAKRVQCLNESIEAMCEEHQIKYVDTFKLFANQQGILSGQYSADGLHLTADAYRKLAEKLSSEGSE